MINGAHSSTNMRLAAVEGKVVRLPTLAGLLDGEPAVEAADPRYLWSTLAAAVLSERAFDDLERDMDDGAELATVIDLASRRRPAT